MNQKEIIEKLKDLKEKVALYTNAIEQQTKVIDKLKENSAIKEYINIKKKQDFLIKERNNFYKDELLLYQKLCNHPLWFFLEDKTDPYDRKTLWECKCLKCSLVKKLNKDKINNENIVYPYESMNYNRNKQNNNFTEVQKEFLEMTKNKEKDISKKLILKYNTQK